MDLFSTFLLYRLFSSTFFPRNIDPCMRPCSGDADCEDRSTGEMCCLDLARPLEWRWGKRSLVKKCCNNAAGVPVLAPQHNLSSRELRELDQGEAQRIQIFSNYSPLAKSNAEDVF